MTQNNVLFICSGNTCRSAMAEGFYNMLSKSKASFSRGIAVFGESQASSYAIAVASSMGADLSGHVAQELADEDMEKAGRVYVMTKQHERYVKGRFPGHEEKVFLLSQEDIEDPWNGNREDYEACAASILRAVEALF